MHFLLLLIVGLPLLLWACSQVDKSINNVLNAHADAIGWRTNPDEMRQRAWERVESERAERELARQRRRIVIGRLTRTIAVFFGVVIFFAALGILIGEFNQPASVDAIVDDILKNKH